MTAHGPDPNAIHKERAICTAFDQEDVGKAMSNLPSLFAI